MNNPLNPRFPFTTPTGEVIIDEMCTCGQRRSLHAARFAPGHGPCLKPGSKCKQFTWISWVFAS
jgi:hypothetical protein